MNGFKTIISSRPQYERVDHMPLAKKNRMLTPAALDKQRKLTPRQMQAMAAVAADAVTVSSERVQRYDPAIRQVAVNYGWVVRAPFGDDITGVLPRLRMRGLVRETTRIVRVPGATVTHKAGPHFTITDLGRAVLARDQKKLQDLT